jgi:hypothetical protein
MKPPSRPQLLGLMAGLFLAVALVSSILTLTAVVTVTFALK